MVVFQLREDGIPHQNLDPSLSAKATLDILAEAYDSVTLSEPFLPFQNSVLPALLALRKTHATVVETRSFLGSQELSLEKGRQRLEAEEANLRDQQALRAGLQNRIQSLRDGLETRMDMSSDQVFKERCKKLKQEKRELDKETSKLLQAVSRFIDDRLGSMLAAEDLGGPVVGDMMDLDSGSLEAGFNSQGKLKKAKDGVHADKRQRRIDDIWGAQESGPKVTAQGQGQRDEVSAASAEMRDLMEQLLNSAMQSEGDASAAYLKISRESAAVRFLVRSKVALFHPKDATRLRLVDFGRELDD
jgi:hypothetical protein